VRHNNPHHGPVQLALRLLREAPAGTYVEVFENRRRKKAFRTVLRLLDRDHDGNLSEEEKTQAHVILFGHSWGASAVVLLARELDHAGVPVLLTVQVDSVAKPWQHDEVIPDNVAAAVNFYQSHGLIHGRSEIKAEDGTKTQILGNYRFDYRQHPVQCEATSWFDRTFTPSHMQSQCDPQIWNRVENLVRERIEPAPILAAVPGQ
jgi:pimeloyl-ACP methyl ester carboxylesterase